MTRTASHDFKPVSAYEVAPDRYTEDMDDSYLEAATLKEFREKVPYKPGDVVWVMRDEPVKAIITHVFREFSPRGNRIELYRIHLANKKGDAFSKSWMYTWPGFIQRGYRKIKEVNGGETA